MRQMMDLGVLIDVSHLSEAAIENLEAISANRQDYPVYASHGYFRQQLLGPRNRLGKLFYNTSHEATLGPSTLRFIARTGGMVGHFLGPDPEQSYPPSGVTNNCHGSTRSFAQGVAWGVDQGIRIGFATDFMGMARGFAPRKGGHGWCLNDRSNQEDQRATPGSGDTDFDTKGLAHVGMIGPAMKDLENIGFESRYMKHITHDAAENFIRMWEKAYSLRRQ